MQFISADSASAQHDLQVRITTELESAKKVLWIISGGSNIDASIEVMANLPSALQPLLTIMLCDERYGPVGHADSNFQQLLDKGFDAQAATLMPVLQEGLSLIETANAYSAVVQAEFAKADVIIAQLGIGLDGHIAGILPDSPAVNASDVTVTSYLSQPYQRVTMTFRALQAIDVDYSFAYGDNKLPALRQLSHDNLSLSQQPSQILKQLPEVYIYNQRGDEL